jgi:MFS family permease
VQPAAWFVFRVVNGLCVLGLYVVVESWLNAQSAGPSRGRLFSLYMMTTLIALGAGQFLLLAGDTRTLTLFAYAAILISLGVIPVAVTRVTEPRIEQSAAIGLRELVRLSPLGAAGAFAAGIVNAAFWGMAPVFGQKLALEESAIALLMSATILGGALLQWPIGHLSDLRDRRVVLIGASGATAAAAVFAALIIIERLPGLVPSAFVYGGLMFSLYGISVAHTNDHLEPEQVLEATRGLLLVFGAGAVCGPLFAGMAMQSLGPVGLPVLSAAITASLAGFGLYRMKRRLPPPLEQQTEYVSLVRTSPVVLEMYPEADLEPELDLEGEDR